MAIYFDLRPDFYIEDHDSRYTVIVSDGVQ